MVVRVLASLKGSMMRRHEHCDASLPHHSCHLVQPFVNIVLEFGNVVENISTPTSELN
jgi:hypothetical protein